MTFPDDARAWRSEGATSSRSRSPQRSKTPPEARRESGADKPKAAGGLPPLAEGEAYGAEIDECLHDMLGEAVDSLCRIRAQKRQGARPADGFAMGQAAQELVCGCVPVPGLTTGVGRAASDPSRL